TSSDVVGIAGARCRFGGRRVPTRTPPHARDAVRSEPRRSRRRERGRESRPVHVSLEGLFAVPGGAGGRLRGGAAGATGGASPVGRGAAAILVADDWQREGDDCRPFAFRSHANLAAVLLNDAAREAQAAASTRSPRTTEWQEQLLERLPRIVCAVV